MDYSGLDNGELSLILATEIIKKEIDNDWNFPEGVSEATLRTAYSFYQYLQDPDTCH